MKPTPEKLELIIKMAKRCASPLPWETDINRANEKIFDLYEALEKALEEIPSYIVNSPRERVRTMIIKTLAKAKEYTP